MGENQVRLTLQNFTAWLFTKSDGEIVGEKQDCHSCVIAQFLIDNGCPRPYVANEKYYKDYYQMGDRSGIRLPQWARQYISRLDWPENPWNITGAVAKETLLDIVVEQSNR